MKSTVLIKSNRYGITVILDDQVAFDELITDVEEKFRDSGKFFEQAKLAVSFEGRNLTDEEERRLIKAITDSCELEIACVVDHNQGREDNFRRVMEPAPALSATESGQFYKGTLRSGQVLESETSIVILGDVNPGSKVIAVGNIVVLGALKGTAWAGITGNENAFVVALEMNPVQIRIGDVIARSTDKKQKTKKTTEPQIAFVEAGNIYIDTLCKEVLNEISWT
ncbi:MAG: septum site-determining protein MinC [Lachnospiraceae bacterium]|nr:septum site-determining protein MinC [Lachnospiraceae bacterium]